jgi:16S rRNA processing protein RimM
VINRQRHFIAVGSIAKAHGVRGDVVVQLLTDSSARFRGLKRAWLGATDQSAVEVAIERAAIETRGVRLKLSILNSREEAEKVRGQLLFVEERNAVRLPKDRHFIHDIIGMDVRDEEGHPLGTVEDVLRYPASDIYVVRNGSREIMIPAVRDFVKKIDAAARRMTVRLIDGMMEE